MHFNRQRALPVQKTHGGKFYLCRRLIRQFSDHDAYVASFAGGESVFWNKPKARISILNDLDFHTAGLLIDLRDSGPELEKILRRVEYKESTFLEALPVMEIEEMAERKPVIDAARYLIVNRMSRGGNCKSFAWSKRDRGGRPGDLNAWHNMVDRLAWHSWYLQGTHILNCDGAEVMREMDGPDVLHYIDPPYHPGTRTVKKSYRKEMTAGQHAAMLEVAKTLKGQVYISGYSCPIYETMLEDWSSVQYSMPNHSGQGREKQRRVEKLWYLRGRRECRMIPDPSITMTSMLIDAVS
jgi:DNA adenine methylase